MRKIISLAATAVVFTLGAAAANAAGSGHDLSPEESPYAILEPQTAAPPAMSEGRSAFMGSDEGYSDNVVRQPHVKRNFHSRDR